MGNYLWRIYPILLCSVLISVKCRRDVSAFHDSIWNVYFSVICRLNALKKSGDEEWKKRVSRPVDLDRLDRRSASPEITPPTTAVKMREKRGLDAPRPSSIADRLSALDSAQEGWRDRVGETDVKKFTIEHKISSSGMCKCRHLQNSRTPSSSSAKKKKEEKKPSSFHYKKPS